MGFLGPAPQFGQVALQSLTPDSSTTSFALDYTVSNEQSMLINYGGVIQEPGVAYTTDSTNVIFTFTPTTGTVLYIIFLGSFLSIPTPAADSVDEAALKDEVASPILLATATASASATIDFDSGIDFTAYTHYRFIIYDCYPATDDEILVLRMSTDGGSTYASTSGNYGWTAIHVSVSGTTATTANSGNDSSATYIALGENSANLQMSNVESEAGAFIVDLYNPSSTTNEKKVTTNGTYRTSNNRPISTSGGGEYDASTSAVDGIRFLMTNGNIAAGEFKLYGIR